jgi:peptidylprolyl isomerase
VSPSRQREREVERLRRIRQGQRREQARRRARRRATIIGSVLAVVVVVGGIALLARPHSGPKTATPVTPAANSPTASPPTQAAPTTSPFPPLARGTDPRLATKPTVRLPSAAPTTLGMHDLVVGTGPAARAGQQLTVNYVGVGYPAGREFDSSWKRREPFTFALGKGNVIPGWDRGLLGMKVGSRRQLAIPAALAYGAQGQPPTIKPNEPLVFVIDLLAAK